jgi:hypothetical protein
VQTGPRGGRRRELGAERPRHAIDHEQTDLVREDGLEQADGDEGDARRVRGEQISRTASRGRKVWSDRSRTNR